MQYLNTHQVLQNLRQQAKDSKQPGPRVVIAGPTDTGKSSLCKMLLNWTVRSDLQPTYVDLDIGEYLLVDFSRRWNLQCCVETACGYCGLVLLAAGSVDTAFSSASVP
jgi:ATPase subunit of ABC transporter with duplicated ATPase domains